MPYRSLLKNPDFTFDISLEDVNEIPIMNEDQYLKYIKLEV